MCVVDPLRSQEISNDLSSLGFSLIEIEAADLAEFECSDADLFVVDNGVALPAALDACPMLRVADGHGTDGPDDATATMLRGDPQSFRSLLAACSRALGFESEEATPASPTMHALHPGKVLVAEDHPINRAVIGRLLEQLGYAYGMATNGEEALVELARDHYDLLITDCHMPVMDGYALTRALRGSDGPNARIPVVALSASALPEQVQRCRDAGMDDFLAKPIQLDALAAKLSALLREAPQAVVPAGVDDGLARLRAVYQDRDQFHSVLRDLLDITRSELDELDQATQAHDASRQRELLHRMEGALSLVAPPPADRRDETSSGTPQRRAAIVATLQKIQSVLDAESSGLRDVG